VKTGIKSSGRDAISDTIKGGELKGMTQAGARTFIGNFFARGVTGGGNAL